MLGNSNFYFIQKHLQLVQVCSQLHSHKLLNVSEIVRGGEVLADLPGGIGASGYGEGKGIQAIALVQLVHCP